jgi:hypothetical protein
VLLVLAVIFEFNGNLAAEMNVREMKVEHRLDDFGSLTETETRDDHHEHGHNPFFSLKSHSKPKKPKPSYGTPRPQYGAPTKSQYLPPKGNYESPYYSKPSPAYNPPPYRPPAYSPPTYPTSYSSSGFVPLYTEKAPAHQSPAYSAPVYDKPSYFLPSEPEYPYRTTPETNKGVHKVVSNNNDFPSFDDFFKQSVKFEQFKI